MIKTLAKSLYFDIISRPIREIITSKRRKKVGIEYSDINKTVT